MIPEYKLSWLQVLLQHSVPKDVAVSFIQKFAEPDISPRLIPEGVNVLIKEICKLCALYLLRGCHMCVVAHVHWVTSHCTGTVFPTDARQRSGT